MASRIDLSNRISLRSIFASVFSTLALMILFMSLVGGFRLWVFSLRELPVLGTDFWMWFFAAWAASLWISSCVAAISSRSTSDHDGLIHGFVTWAVTVDVFGPVLTMLIV
jgi:hypothetical protein